MFSRDEGLHLIGPKVVVKLVYMKEGLVWFPTVTPLSKSCAMHFEFYTALLGSISTMTANRGLRLWIWVVELFRIDGGGLLHHLVRASVPGEELSTGGVNNT